MRFKTMRIIVDKKEMLADVLLSDEDKPVAARCLGDFYITDNHYGLGSKRQREKVKDFTGMNYRERCDNLKKFKVKESSVNVSSIVSQLVSKIDNEIGSVSELFRGGGSITEPTFPF